LVQIGLEPDRIRMFYMSSAMGGAFAEAAEEMTERITELGPSPLRTTGNGSRIDEPEMSIHDPEWSGS
jgi:F420-non-reducing hydrogenase iron-sulfur subunit